MVRDLALAGAYVVGGAINAFAGGGTLVAFPAAIASGLSAVVANATNSVAMAPGALASAWAYRCELAREKALVRTLAIPSVLGAVAGALLLLATPQSAFDAIAPALVLFAACMLVAQDLRKEGETSARAWPAWLVFVAQLFVSIYGGYFGAGMGFLMLALLRAMGHRDIHRMNAVRNALGGAINGIASIAFVVSGRVDYRAGAITVAAAIVGGWGGAAIARKLAPVVVRRGVAALGIAVTIGLAWKARR